MLTPVEKYVLRRWCGVYRRQWKTELIRLCRGETRRNDSVVAAAVWAGGEEVDWVKVLRRLYRRLPASLGAEADAARTEALRHDPERATARFWEHSPAGDGGMVKLSLRPGEFRRWAEFHHTDEGYSSRSVVWHHHSTEIVRERYEKHRDCDGVVEHFEEAECLPGLRADARIVHGRSPGLPGLVVQEEYRVPRWETVVAGQRDHAAEAMNY